MCTCRHAEVCHSLRAQQATLHQPQHPPDKIWREKEGEDKRRSEIQQRFFSTFSSGLGDIAAAAQRIARAVQREAAAAAAQAALRSGSGRRGCTSRDPRRSGATAPALPGGSSAPAPRSDRAVHLPPGPRWRSPSRAPTGGAGEDHGIDHSKSWLRFPYDSTFLRSHYISTRTRIHTPRPPAHTPAHPPTRAPMSSAAQCTPIPPPLAHAVAVCEWPALAAMGGTWRQGGRVISSSTSQPQQQQQRRRRHRRRRRRRRTSGAPHSSLASQLSERCSCSPSTQLCPPSSLVYARHPGITTCRHARRHRQCHGTYRSHGQHLTPRARTLNSIAPRVATRGSPALLLCAASLDIASALPMCVRARTRARARVCVCVCVCVCKREATAQLDPGYDETWALMKLHHPSLARTHAREHAPVDRRRRTPLVLAR
jgi:hypothetical protein